MKNYILLAVTLASVLTHGKVMEVSPKSISLLPSYSTKSFADPAIIVAIANENGTSEVYEIQQYIYRPVEFNVLKTATSRVSLAQGLIEYAIKNGKNIIIDTDAKGAAAFNTTP